MDWKQRYGHKLISAEEAAQRVKSGDTVAFAAGREASSIGYAIASRVGELKGVNVRVGVATVDFGWYDPGFEESFDITVGFPMPIVMDMVNEHRCDVSIGSLHFAFGEEERRTNPVEVLLIEVSSPDEKGYCSFGASVWGKKKQVRSAKLVIGEVNDRLIHTYGDNYIHESEIHYFVEHEHSGEVPGQRDLRFKDIRGTTAEAPPEYLKTITGYVREIVKDGDTCQIGVGSGVEHLVRLGLFEGRHDMGWHSEHTPGGLIRLVQEGVFTGRCKTINQGKMVSTALAGTQKELEFASMNPMFELREVDYTNDPRVISSHDNMVAINQALAIDLWGQVCAEQIGTRWVSTAGGQPAFAVGAQLSNGGRNITVIPATARTKQGVVSNIMPEFPPSTVITLPRTLTDYVVNEYGIARLRGRTARQKMEELIAIAHPDYRGELKAAAGKMLWP